MADRRPPETNAAGAGAGLSVTRFDEPASVLRQGGDFLAARPIEHNIVLSLLGERVEHPVPGRYWMIQDGSRPVGVVFQSPLDFPATITPMTWPAIDAAVAAIVAGGAALPGVIGDAGSAARFAGQWSELAAAPVAPVSGQRLYRLVGPVQIRSASGGIRRATSEDADVVLRWFDAFASELGQSGTPADVAAHRLAEGRFVLWEDGAPVSMAAASPSVAGIARIGPVYTPPSLRGHGYAGACVGQLSRALVASGASCILYADLENPTSNALYRRLGYRAVQENLRYVFDPSGRRDGGGPR